MEKYLIVGLGNPGPEYHETRHNAGWMVVDSFAAEQGVTFEDKRYGYVAETSVKGRKLILLKPTTYMNLSGNAVRYWLEKENIPNRGINPHAIRINLRTGNIICISRSYNTIDMCPDHLRHSEAEQEIQLVRFGRYNLTAGIEH